MENPLNTEGEPGKQELVDYIEYLESTLEEERQQWASVADQVDEILVEVQEEMESVNEVEEIITGIHEEISDYRGLDDRTEDLIDITDEL